MVERIGQGVKGVGTPPQVSHAVKHLTDSVLVLLIGGEAVLQVGRHLTGSRGHALADLPLGVTLLLEVGDVGVVAHCVSFELKVW